MLVRLVRAGEAGLSSGVLRREFYALAATDESAERLLRGDLRLLRERGLVRTRAGTDLITYVGPNGRKPPQWVLTRDEHKAIFDARKRLRTDIRLPYPTAREDPLERVFLLVRILEEAGGVLDRRDAEQWTGWSWRQFQATAIVVKEVFDAEDVFHVELEQGDDYTDEPPVTCISLKRERAGDLRGTGTEILGVFPYSAAEVQERLDIIDEALGTAGPDDTACLESARHKLLGWRDRLRHEHQQRPPEPARVRP